MTVRQNFETLVAQAATLLSASNPEAAIGPLKAAINLKPGDSNLYHDLGLACLESGQMRDAVDAFKNAVAIRQNFPEAYFRMAIALESLSDFKGAVAAYHKATELKPGFPEAWFRAGALVYALGHRKEALGCFRRAKSFGRSSEIGLLAEARVLLTEERDRDAIKFLRHMLAQFPENAMALDLLGGLLSESGEFEEARGCFVRAIALAPSLAGSYYELVRCRPIVDIDEPIIFEMQSALSFAGLGAEQRLRIHLAIGKAAEDLGRYELAMLHFDNADKIRRDAVKFDSVEFARAVDRVIASCSLDVISKARVAGTNSDKPIFIVGMPRTGTTLLEKIIASHSMVAAGGERNFWNARGARWISLGMTTDSQFISYAAADYLDDLKQVSSTAAKITDKMPFNFLWAGLIHLAFPNATIIHCKRDAVDTALSIHQTYFHPTLAFPTGGQELVDYFRGYQKIIGHWQTVIAPQRFITCEYEELTNNPESTIRKIVAACGLPWEDACLHHHRSPSFVKTPSKWQIRQPIYRSSVARSKHYEPWLGPLAVLAKK
jgi:tetratricopeptide (TPR) repeat protein